MWRVRRIGFGLVLLVMASAAAAPPRPRPLPPAAGLGLAVEFESEPTAAALRRTLQELHRTGVSVFGLATSWSAAEPSVGRYRLGDLTRTARILRQSGATLHLDLPLVVGRSKDVPEDLAAFAFDDRRLAERLGQLFDALEPALLDFSTLSLGYEADAYFADKPEELRAYRLLFEGAVRFLEKKVPHLKIGVTTMAPTESLAPAVAATLHQRSPVLFYLYSPFERGTPYVHRTPEAIEHDWKLLLDRAGGRPIAFPEVSYSSAAGNGSSPEKQAEFVKRLRRLVAASDGQKLLFARYVPWRDPSAGRFPVEPAASETRQRKAMFLSHRGLQTSTGEGKPAWREWVKAGR